ncbi:MAG: hypothetical protein J6S23_02275 [Clostridia bacterium]|nr:hypothetical protein [Clostridia bacterium]
MNYKYVLTKTTYYNGEHTRTSYGIAVISTEDNVTVLCSIEDVSDEQDELAKLAELCNAEKLEIEHIQNVVEDFLCVRR